MGHRQRYAARVDANQKQIVDELRDMGISVELGHDDILCGWRGRTWWFELKDKDKLFLKDGVTFRKGAIKPSQSELRKTWQGQYDIVWSIDQILKQMGITK